MRVCEHSFLQWALSKKFHDEGECFLLGPYCWPNAKEGGIALFKTRKRARKAQETCCYRKTQVERVRVTVEIIKNDS